MSFFTYTISMVLVSMRVRIRRVPPTLVLEGVDLRGHRLREGHVYDLKIDEAVILLAWGYAEPACEPDDSGALGTYRIVT